MLTSITRISTSIAVYWIQVFWQAKRSWGSYRSKHSLWFFLPCPLQFLPTKLTAFLTNITESNWSIVLLSRLEISGSSGNWIVHNMIPTNQPTKQTSCKRRPQTSCNVQARWQYLDLQKPTSKSNAALLLLTTLLDFIEGSWKNSHDSWHPMAIITIEPAIWKCQKASSAINEGCCFCGSCPSWENPSIRFLFSLHQIPLCFILILHFNSCLKILYYKHCTAIYRRRRLSWDLSRLAS